MKKKQNKNEFYYCSNRQCTHMECLRYWRNAPWNTLFIQIKCAEDKNGKCKDYIENMEDDK